MNTKIISTGKARLLFVKLPEGEIPCHTYENTLSLRDSKSGTLCNAIGLPPGKWSDPVRVEEVTEEMAYEVVRSFGQHNYRDYTAFLALPTALKSFQSLLKANEIYTVNPYNDFECPNQWCENGYIDQGYNEKWRCNYCQENEDKHDEAQENTGSWIMLVEKL